MFGFLKKKISEIKESISSKVKSKVDDQLQQQPLENMEAAQGPIVSVEENDPNSETEVIEIDFPEEQKTQDEPVEDIEAPQADQTEKEPEVETTLADDIMIDEKEIEAETSTGTERNDLLSELGVPEAPIAEPDAPTKTEDIEIVETVREEVPEIERQEPIAEEVRPATQMQEIAVAPEPPQERKSFFGKLTEKIVKKVTEKKLTEEDVNPMLADMEVSLVEADVAVMTAEKIKEDIRSALVGTDIKRGKEDQIVVDSFRRSMMDILDVPRLDLDSLSKQKKPTVVVFWGFNGAGKTTSLAKTASWLKQKGYSCVLAAADTFRAGAEEQLEIHGERIGFKVVKHQYGADPAAVIFDAVEHAKAKGIDFVLADTAGRAHTNANLMDQMKKIVRVNKPDVKILVIDSLTGNDALTQAQMYGEVGVDALIFTKVDVNEKGGAILSVTHELKKPILFLGMGQEYSEFEEFDARKFVDRVVG